MRLQNPLFAPADSVRKTEKAIASVADAVILDLEDSVAVSAKLAARDGVVATLAKVDRSRIIIRINAADTPWYLDDLVAVVPLQPAAILLPKCAGGDDLRRLDHHLQALERAAGLDCGATRILALATETAASVQQLHFTGASERLLALCFGAEDLAVDLGIDPRDQRGQYAAPIGYARSRLLLAATEAGVPALDTPWPDPRDPVGLQAEVAASARDGFAGKLCIHPDQLAPVAAAFAPSQDRIAWSLRVCEAFSTAPDAGVVSIDGKMVDRPHLVLAQRTLRIADGVA